MNQLIKNFTFGIIAPIIYFFVYIGTYITIIIIFYILFNAIGANNLGFNLRKLFEKLIIVYSAFFSIVFFIRVTTYYLKNKKKEQWLDFWKKPPKFILVDILGISWKQKSLEEY